MTEYNPASTDETAIASPTPAPESLGDGGIKALSAEREQRKILEKQNKQLEAMLAENKKALEQSQMTLEQKYQADLELSRSAYQQQVDAAIAERDQLLQQERDARLTFEQKAQILENQRAIQSISGEFTETFAPLLTNPKKVKAYMAEIADDLTVDANGQPALIARRDANGQPMELAPISAAIAYFQQEYPDDFKPPAEQKTGGGFRNLANTGASRSSANTSKLQLPPMGAITAEQFLANREAIAKGDFEVVKP